MTFSVGSRNGVSRIVTLPIFGDDMGEPDETFTVSLIPQRPEGDVGAEVSITIIDNERE